jgi:putative FmdB family regulatory protein
MPTYVYKREDGTKFEIQQKITDEPLEECPETGQDVQRIISGSANLIFKGDGFYVNDYKQSDRPSDADRPQEASNGEGSNGAASNSAASDQAGAGDGPAEGTAQTEAGAGGTDSSSSG